LRGESTASQDNVASLCVAQNMVDKG
jgi:hypothetical protein